MPLSPPSSRRALKHTRAIQVEAFAREDGLWDIDAHITDTKTRDTKLASGVRPAGQPVHDLWLRITVDTALNVVDAEAVSDAVPYPNYCDTIGPAYKKLIGLNLLKGFRDGVKQRLSGINGCTHLTELAAVLPTATCWIRAMARATTTRARNRFNSTAAMPCVRTARRSPSFIRAGRSSRWQSPKPVNFQPVCFFQ